MPLSLAIVDDHPLVVAGLRTLLEPYADRVRLSVDASWKQSPGRVDAVLQDLFGGRTVGGPDARHRLGCPYARLIAFSWSCEAPLVSEAMARGADGFVLKSAEAVDLVDAVERVHLGERVLPTVRVLASVGRWPGDAHLLSRRESEIISLVSQGLSNAEIAARAFVSINTVKTYIRSAYRKIGATTRPQAVIWALEHGFHAGAAPWSPDPGAREAV